MEALLVCGLSYTRWASFSIVRKIFYLILMNCLCSLSECHSCHALILRDDNISCPTSIDQGKVHSVNPCPNRDHFAGFGGQNMIRITQEDARDSVPLSNFLRDAHNRAGVCVNQNGHILFPSFQTFGCSIATIP